MIVILVIFFNFLIHESVSNKVLVNHHKHKTSSDRNVATSNNIHFMFAAFAADGFCPEYNPLCILSVFDKTFRF
jgi:hypothetical protein